MKSEIEVKILAFRVAQFRSRDKSRLSVTYVERYSLAEYRAPRPRNRREIHKRSAWRSESRAREEQLKRGLARAAHNGRKLRFTSPRRRYPFCFRLTREAAPSLAKTRR